MDIKRNDPSKVIVIPRPPRSADQGMVPAENPDAVDTDEIEVEQEQAPLEAIDPGCPLNNQVEGPAQGLAGDAQPAEEAAEEAAEEE